MARPGVPRPARACSNTPRDGSPHGPTSVRRWASSWATSSRPPAASIRASSPRCSRREQRDLRSTSTRRRSLVFALAHDVERWPTLLPHYVRSRRDDADGSGGRSSSSSPAGRSCRSSASGCRWSGDRGRGTSPDPSDSVSSTSPARRAGWTSPGGSSVAATARLPRHDRARLLAGDPRVRLVRRSVLHAADRRPDAGDVQGAGRGAGPRAVTNPRHERPTARLDHRHRPRHADRDRRGCVPRRAARAAVAGQADRPLRSIAVPLPGRRPGRRLRPAGLDAAEDRAPARPVQPVRDGRRAARAGRCRTVPGAPGAAEPRAGRDLPRLGARRHRVRRGAARAVPREGHPPGGARTSPSPCSAARRRPTSGSRSTSAARSCRPPTRAPPARVALGEALGDLREGRVDAAIAGGCEVPLSPLAFGAFDIIRALSAGHNDDPATPRARSMPSGTASSWARARRCSCSRRRRRPSDAARRRTPSCSATGPRPMPTTWSSHGPTAAKPRGPRRSRSTTRGWSRARSTTSTRMRRRRRSATWPRRGPSRSPSASAPRTCR